MYHKLHEHFKTLLLFILVVYAALNYYEKHLGDIPTTEYNKSIDDYQTYKAYDKIVEHLSNIQGDEQYFDESHPII